MRTDQRGFPLVGVRDLGAYEAGTLTDFTTFIWETLPATATVAQHAATFDFDGDGANNENEYLAGTIVTNPASVFRVTAVSKSGVFGSLTFPTVLGRTYSLESSTDLVTWQPLAGSFAGTGNPRTLLFGPITGVPKFFVRPRVGP